MARGQSTSTDVATAEPQVGEVGRFKRVIIQRPAGNTDTHIFLGFNSFENHFPFDKPVELPADMVEYYRSQKRPEFYPDETGRPMISYVAAYSIIDA